MKTEVKQFETWKEVFVDFFEQKVGQSKLYKACDYIKQKNDDIKTEKDIKKLEKLISARNKKMSELEQLRKDAIKGEIKDWFIDKFGENTGGGSKIFKTTHVLKFTHSSACAGGYNFLEKSNSSLLSTGSLKKQLLHDYSHSNGTLITISRLLSLKLSDKPILDLILNQEFSFLKDFAISKKEFKIWSETFSELIIEKDLKSAEKGKQIFFPLSSNSSKEYHIIVPLFSSSLAQEVYNLQNELQHGDKQKSVKEAREGKTGINGYKSFYHSSEFVAFPKLAIENFGGDYPRNVSMLNADRSGKSYLLPTQPPTWQTHLKPPIIKKSLFEMRSFLPNARDDINYLREYLMRFNHIGISIKDPERFKWVDRWMSTIIEEFINHIVAIQKLPAGWSDTKEIKLKPEHQYLLDPFRQDEQFQAARQATNWQKVVCDDFGRWLNNRVRGRDKKFTPTPELRTLWAKFLDNPLREHNELIEIEYKRRIGEDK